MKMETNVKAEPTIYVQLLRMLFVFSLLPLLAVSLFNYHRATAELEQFVDSEIRNHAEVRKSFIEDWFQLRVAELQLLGRAQSTKTMLAALATQRKQFQSNQAFLSSAQWVDINSLFGREVAQFSLSYEHVYDVYLIDMDGNILFSLAKEEDFGANLNQGTLANTPFATSVKRSLTTPGVHFSDLFNYQISNGLTSGFLSQQISDEFLNPIGVVAIQLRWETLFDGIEQQQASFQDLRTFVVGPEMRYRRIDNSEAASELVAPYLQQPLLSTLGTQQSELRELQYSSPEGVDFVAVTTRMFLVDKSWYLLLEVNKTEAVAAINELWRYLLLSLVIASLIVFWLARKFTEKFSVPIDAVVAYSRNVANGGVKERLELSGSQEVSALSNALNDMLESLQDNKIELIASKQEQEASLNEVQELRFATDQHCIVTITNLQGKIEYANDKFIEVSGYSKEEILGNTHRIINSGIHPKRFFEQMYQTLESGTPWHGQICNRNKDGDLFWLDTSIIPFKGFDKKIIKYFAIRTDITNHKLSAAALEKNKQQLELLISSTGVGMWDWNLDTNQIDYSEPWARLVGSSLAALHPLSENTWMGRVHPDDLPQLQEQLQKLRKGAIKQFEQEFRLKHKTDGWVWVLDSVKVVEADKFGIPQRLIGTTLDISKQKQTTTQLNQSRDQFQSLVDNIPGISYRCLLDAHWTMLFISHQVNRVLGYDPADIINNAKIPFAEVILPEFRDYVENTVLDAVYSNKSWTLEYQAKTKSGDIKWLYEKGQAVTNEHGDVECLDGFILDITERKEQQQEILKLSRVAAQTNNAVVLTDKQGSTEWINGAFTDITGFELPELLGKKPGALLQGELTDRASVARMREAIRTIEPFQETLVNYHKDGSPYWIEIRCNPIYDESGQHQGFIAIETDVSENIQTTEALALQKRLLENMSRLGRIGAWQVDLVSNSIYWSSMTKQIHEVEENFVPELETAVNFYKEGYSRDKINEVVARGMETGEPWNEELQLVTAKGNEIWVAAYGEVQKDGDQVVRLFGSFQDINEQKLAQIEEQKVARLNKSLAQINEEPSVLNGKLSLAREVITTRVASELDVARCAIWHFDSTNDEIKCIQFYDRVNKSFHSGMTLNRSEHGAYFDLLDGEPLICSADVLNNPKLAPFAGYFSQLNISSVLNHVFQLGDGDMGILVTEHIGDAREWSEAEQQFVVSVGIILGGVFLSEQRRLTQQRLLIAKEQAEQAAKVKSEFLATMSHEIRTPMNGVLGMLELLQSDDLSMDQQRKTQIAISSANALLTIINEILDFSRLDSGKLVLEHIEFELRELVESTLSSVALLAQEKGLELVSDINLPDEIKVKGDPVRIRQIMTNLLGNAVKFTHRGDVVLSAFGVSQDGQYQLHLSVSDTGVGIAKEKQATLFEPFTQVDASTTRRFGGSGLGLAICHKLTAAMQGSIGVESDENQGSTFSVSLPLTFINEKIDSTYSDLKATNLVVIDENVQAIQALKSCFKNSKVTIRGYRSTDKLMTDDIQDFRVDAILLSRKVTLQKGNEVLAWLKQHFSTADIILMTELMDKGGIVELQKLGFSGFVSKPILKRDLMDRLLKRSGNIMEQKEVSEAAKPSPRMQLPSSSDTSSEQAKRVLLVEDNKVNQQVALMMLKKLGYRAEVAENGVQALARLQATEMPFDLILMDCQMPEMDGYEATKQIRQGNAGTELIEIPIIALTANAMAGDADKCIDAGMNAYLSKPVQALALKGAIEKFV